MILFFDPFNWGVGSTLGGGIVIVRHETKVVNVNVKIEECLHDLLEMGTRRGEWMNGWGPRHLGIPGDEEE